ADKILIATGSHPTVPHIPGIEHVISSNEALDLPQLPRRIVIVGGGYIAVEFAGIFNGFGAEVVELIRREELLYGFDDDIRIAVGDVTDRINLTPVAIAEGRALAETLFNDNPIKMDHANVPSAVFSQPPIGAVGLTEEEARRQYGEVDIYSARFKPMKNTLSGRDERTLMKLVVDARSERVLGCHMLGPDAPEIMQGLAIAVKCGVSKRM